MIKTITFAILHFSVAFGVTYVLTGSIGISGAVALIEPMVNTVVFYFHEKAWNRYERKRMPEGKAPYLCTRVPACGKCVNLGLRHF